MIKRPKPGEEEEDILRMQEEYLAEKSKSQTFEPAAKLVRIGKNEPIANTSTPSSSARKPSKYAQAKGLKNHNEKKARMDSPKPSSSLVGDVLERNSQTPAPDVNNDGDDKVNHPKCSFSILGQIVEKKYDTITDVNVCTMPSQGFPTVLKHNVNLETGDRSIFLRHTRESNDNPSAAETMSMDVDRDMQSIKDDKLTIDSLNMPAKSFILTSNEADIIHGENIQKLSAMSEKEILEEQNNLLSNLSPQLVEFLKSKRKDAPLIETVERSTEIEEKMDTTEIKAVEDVTEDDGLWENDVLFHPNINKWLHFDSLEKDKLAWIKGIKESEQTHSDQPYEARFDFKGYLMPYTIEYTEETKSLFHHGEEPHRPGYSLTELFELSRSTVTQQRVVALNTLAGILEYYMAGTYHGIIEIPLSKIFFIIRFALDENKAIILEPALRAMRNLFYNRIDEASLESLLGFGDGFQQPSLENDKSEISDLDLKESELKDFHLAEIDLISAALRTDIVQRIHYILSSLRPSFNCVQYSLQILIRIIRDSVNSAKKVVEMDYLMTTVVQHFVPVTSINFSFQPHIAYNGKPVIAALKFIRVLSLQSTEISEILVKKYDILKPISEYIASSVDDTYGLQIQIEAFCILSNLLHCNLGIYYTTSLFPTILTTLFKHVQGTDIFVHSSIPSVTHAAVLLQLMVKILNCNLTEMSNVKFQLYPLIKDGLGKWLGQLSNADSFTCAHLRLVSSVLDCCKALILTEPNLIQDSVRFLKSFSSSKGFQLIVSLLHSSSNILSGIETKQLHADKNLINLGATVVDTSCKVLPILNVTSSLPFLVSLFKLLERIDQSDVVESFLINLADYVHKVKMHTLSLCDNWFSRMEIDLIVSIIKSSIKLRNLSEPEKDVLYVVANKLCYVLRTDKKSELEFLFNSLVFNKNWFTAHRIMNLISISDSTLSAKLMSVDEIKMCYSRVINLNDKNNEHDIVLTRWQEPILPRDWIYLPILKLYSESQLVQDKPKVVGTHATKVEKLKAAEKESLIKCSLEWIIINELCFSDLLSDIDLTDRFCRIMCIFLCDNSLFLDDNIKALLRHCIGILFKKERNHKFVFDKSLVGLNNFQDFYTQFLEQFQSVSYGDFNFAACVLVPLAQKHDVKWRKLLWSEYAGCLRALDCPEEYLCYNINEYLHPEETDESLLKSYLRALSGNLLRPNTVAYKIALHHVTCFKNRTATK